MPLQLHVEIDPKAGFCFGVKNTIRQAEEILGTGVPLYCLGEIVHNQEEVKRLEAQGMITIDHEKLPELRNQQVLIRAHGEPPLTYKELLSNGNTIHEATCPIVLKLQDKVKVCASDEDYVLIYGKSTHPEVVGLLGQNPTRSQAFRSMNDLDHSLLPPKLFLYSQTTMDKQGLLEAKSQLEKLGKEVVLKNTICGQVSNRKPSIQAFAASVDVMVFVAGRTSSNGKVLFEQCLESNPRSHFISELNELDSSWFSNGQEVGISGATSTPQWLMEKVQEHLERY